ncbi:sensor histidine kinase [Prochlorothrix hollandica]|uniref:histidine kinase n=1 Tax=Prochlorothrix hollandica PCC 9006 = CALU 1027 TaxID=317619 RepID=A0A0M2PYT2_PROHO|nr:HAMP domain-containing sensor histidine kinase [Prochlorothrix hollandica]KKI99833.1 histidine kinase [Prochlorothrix hollandica PCC 9006 = CALU 1027]
MFQATRRRLALWYTALTAVLLLLFASSFYFYVRHTLIERIDDTLSHVAEVVERSLVIEAAPDGLVWMIDGHVSQQVNVEASFRNNILFSNDDDHIDLEWFSAQGTLLWSTFSDPLDLEFHGDRKGETVAIQPGLYGEEILLRQMTLPVQLGRQILGYLRVSHPWFEVTKPIRQLFWDLCSGLALVLGAVTAMGWFLSGLAIRPVQESYQHLKQFTADASHELRNPIAIIQANVQATLAEPLPDAHVQQQLQVVERLTRRLGRLVDDLLFLARQDSGMVQPQWSRVDLDEVLLEVVEEQEANALDRQITISLDFPDIPPGPGDDNSDPLSPARPPNSAPGSPEPQGLVTETGFQLRGDREQLARLFTNLISNAIQYTPQGGEVQVILHQDPPVVVRGKGLATWGVAVVDTGAGIAAEDLPHVFDRFYRVDPARCRQGSQGSGLGLAIVQAIAQAHQGHVQVQSQLHQGSRFTVTLPALPGE